MDNNLAVSKLQSDPDSPGSQAIDRAMLLLRLIVSTQADGISLSEIVKLSGFTKPTARRIVVALINNGLVEQAADSRRYYAGSETYALGVLSSVRFGAHRLAIESLPRLAAASGDAALLSISLGNETICLAREEGSYPLRSHVLQPGHRHPLGCGAPGIALLALRSDEDVEASLAANAQRLASDYPRMTPEIIRQEVQKTRESGYALNGGLIFKGSWGMAIAVEDPQSATSAALAIASVEVRFTPERVEELAKILSDEKRRVEGVLRQRQHGKHLPFDLLGIHLR